MNKIKISFAVTLTLLCFGTTGLSQPIADRPRTIVTTDGEIDDVDSFIRMLLYANEFHLEGLVYSSSMWHYKGDGTGKKIISEMEMTKKIYGEKTDLCWPGTHWMQDLIDAYEKVYPKLHTHASGFPTASELRNSIKVGNVDFEGEMEKNTEGSDFIKQKLLDNNPNPIYLQVWGGTNTIARALKSIEDDYKNKTEWSVIQKRVSEKTILYAILDQDATYRKYISVNWPSIKVYYNSSQFWCLAYPWKKAIPEKLHYVLEGKFMSENIIHNHGPLTAMYYSYGDGQKQVGDDEHIHGDLTKIKKFQWGNFNQYDFISEGDSPAFLHLIDVGLGNLENPQVGGWGGRLKQSKVNPHRWEDGDEVADFNPFTEQMDLTYPQTRWIIALQNDFAARADWCVMDFKEANHPPIVTLEIPSTLSAKPGTTVQLKGSAKDPDGNELDYRWWHYDEADSYSGKVIIKEVNSKNTSFIIPPDSQTGDNIHIILEVTDKGKPSLKRYQRLVVNVTR